MVWVRIDDRMPDNPKVAAAGPLALAMQVAGLCYSNRELTDGFIPRAIARRLLDWSAEDESGTRWRISRVSGMSGDDVDAEWVIGLLVDAGMWHETAGGYRIHDYEEYQPSKQDVLDLSAKRSAAGRRGGLAKAKASAKQAPSKSQSKTEAKTYPEPEPVPLQDQPLRDVEDVTDDTLRGFEEFWKAWPRRNGKKLYRAKAETQWRKLSLTDRREAYRGAVNYAKASEAGAAGAMDAFRWLRDKCWPDWQDPAEVQPKTSWRDKPVTLMPDGSELPL